MNGISNDIGNRKTEKLFRWQVTLDGKSCIVTGEDKLEASRKATKQFGGVWGERVRDMEFLKLGSVKNV